jgi:Flagellar hook-length control protein FliK.
MKANSINITSQISPALQQKLSLKPGQIVRAQVVKSEGKQVLLQLGKNILKAQAKVPLKAGDRLELQVESAREQEIELKIIKDAVQLKPEDTALIKLGFKPQEEMYTVLRQLVKFNLPVTQASILELYNLISQYQSTESMIQAAAWLKTIGIKVESEKDFIALETLHRFFKRELPADKEERLFSFLNEKENTVFGGYNIFSWPVAGQHVFLLTPESKRERLQPESCRVLLQLNSRSLEDIWVKLELDRKVLKAGIICSHRKYRTILSRETRGLKEALQAAGYTIEAIDVEVNPDKLTILDLIPQQPRQLYEVNYQI